MQVYEVVKVINYIHLRLSLHILVPNWAENAPVVFCTLLMILVPVLGKF